MAWAPCVVRDFHHESLLKMAVDFTENKVGIISLGIAALQALVSWFLGFWVGKKLRSNDKWILVWLFYDLLTHFTLEGPFVYISLAGTVENSDNPVAMIWREYGKADSRWLHSDPNILSVEIITVVLGFLNIALVYAICQEKYYRHFLQITLCVTELYGGWMTFCPEWLTGSKHLNTRDPVHHFIYLWFFNGLWVLIPSLLLLHSLMDMKENHSDHSHKKYE